MHKACAVSTQKAIYGEEAVHKHVLSVPIMPSMVRRVWGRRGRKGEGERWGESKGGRKGLTSNSSLRDPVEPLTTTTISLGQWRKRSSKRYAFAIAPDKLIWA